MTDRRSLRHSARREFVLIIITLFAITVSAQTTTFNYQGHMKSGASAANGNYEMEFKLFDAAKDGGQIGKTFTAASVAVVNGTFTVGLDFDAAPFEGGAARYLEIGVRLVGSPDPFTTLTPRQEIRSTPYAVQARNATGGGGGGGVGGSGTPGSVPMFTGGTTIGNSGITQTGSAPNARLEIAGTAIVRTPGGGSIDLHTPNAETGITFGVNGSTARADLRFDGTSVKLVARSPGSGPPPDTNGIVIDTAGNVGIGTASPTATLHVGRGRVPGVLEDSFSIRAENGLVRGDAIWASATGTSVASRGILGTSINGTGVYGDTTANFDDKFELGAGVIGIGRGSVDGIGVYGRGTRVGVQGVGGPIGVLGFGTSWAGYFQGKVFVGALGTGSSVHVCYNANFELSNCSSSLRYKTNLMPFQAGLSLIDRLRPVTFNWKASHQADLGLVAEEVATVEPLLTFRNERGEIEGVKYDQLTVVLINAVKQQQTQIEAQELQNRVLQKRIELLTKGVCSLDPKAEVCEKE